MAVSKEDLIETLSNMSILEVTELVSELEEKWGVSAAAAVAAPVMAAGGDAGAEEVKEGSEGVGRRRSVDGQRSATQGRSRRRQENARGSWRDGGSQVTRLRFHTIILLGMNGAAPRRGRPKLSILVVPGSFRQSGAYPCPNLER